MEIQDLVGREVVSVEINDARDLVVLHTKTGDLFLSWEGDCCAHCYLANVSGSENLLGATITGAEHADWEVTSKDTDYCSVTESMGSNIKTSKGYVSLESRLEHNGYYGGSVVVSEEHPWRYRKRETSFKPLTDF